MVNISIRYDGELRCTATHGPSGTQIFTDAPVDNHGKGQSFSPTDLVGTALGTCMLTIMGIVAKREGIDLRGATVDVTKEMTAQPTRRIGKLTVVFTVPGNLSEVQKQKLENAAHTCPVCRSISADVLVEVSFRWSVNPIDPKSKLDC